MQSDNIIFPEIELVKIFERFTKNCELVSSSSLPTIFKDSKYLSDSIIDAFFEEFFKLDQKHKDEELVYDQFRIIAILLKYHPNYTPEILLSIKTHLKYPIDHLNMETLSPKLSLKLVLDETYNIRSTLYTEKCFNIQNKTIIKMKGKKTHSLEPLENTFEYLEKLVISKESQTEVFTKLCKNKENDITQEILFEFIKSNTTIRDYPEIYGIWLKRLGNFPHLIYSFEDFEKILVLAEKLVGVYLDFQIIDKNKNGSISVQEFVDSIENSRINISETSFIKDYDLINQDKADGITYTELIEYVLPEEKEGLYEDHIHRFFLKYRGEQDQFIECFRTLDENNNGRIEKIEFLQGFQKGKKIAGRDLLSLFDVLDRNSDGFINFEEFYQGGIQLGLFPNNERIKKDLKENKEEVKDNENQENNSNINNNVNNSNIPQEQEEEKKSESILDHVNNLPKETKPDFQSNFDEFKKEIDDVINKPAFIPKENPAKYSKEIQDRLNFLKNDNFTDLEALKPKDRVLTYFEKTVWDFFDTIKDVLKKDTEEVENPENIEYILRSMKAFFLIVKDEQAKNAPKFIKLNEMLTELIKNFEKHTQKHKITMVKEYFVKLLDLKVEHLEKSFKDREEMANIIKELSKQIKEKDENIKKLEIDLEVSKRNLEKEKTINNQEIEKNELINDSLVNLKAEYKELDTRNELILKDYKDLELLKKTKEVEYLNKQKDFEKREDKIAIETKKNIQKAADLKKKEEDLDLKTKITKENLESYKNMLDNRGKEIDELSKKTWEEINSQADSEKKKYVELMRNYKEDMKLKNLMNHYEKKKDGGLNENFKEEKEKLLIILGEFKLKIEHLVTKDNINEKELKELRMKLEENEKGKKVITYQLPINEANNNDNDEEIESLKNLIKKQENQITEMRLVGRTTAGESKNTMIFFVLLVTFVVFGIVGISKYIEKI